MTATASKGKVISLEYTVRSEDNQVIDTNVGENALTYKQGAKQIIAGVESAVEGMTVGQAKQVVVAPKDGYGERDPNAFYEMPKEKVPSDVRIGMLLQGKDKSGHNIQPMVAEIKKDSVILDFNHPLAGKTLFFDLKVLNIHSE